MPPANSNITTRQRILAYLAEHHRTSAQELAQSWGLTQANIRYHLSELLQNGVIERVPLSIGGSAGAGRPRQFYRLATSQTPNNLPALCRALLLVLRELHPGRQQENSIRAVANAMIGFAVANSYLGAKSNPIRRLGMTIDCFDSWKYRARWEAGVSGPRILLRKCPYVEIIDEYPELCLLDQFLLEGLTGISFQQKTKMDHRTGKPPACIFSSS